MPSIESPYNETYKRLLSLTRSKGLKKEGLFLLSGSKLIDEFLSRPTLEIVHELTTGTQTARLGEALQVHLSLPLFKEIDVLGTDHNILVLKQPSIDRLPDDLKAYEPRGIEVVLPVGDPGNLGALLRSCEAFSVPKVILSQEAAHPFLPKAVKASAGSVMRLPLCQGPALNDFPRTSIALDLKGIAIDQFVWPKNGLLVVGEEGPGLALHDAEPFSTRIRIPTKGVQSLNVVVAASIALAYRASLTEGSV